MGKPVTNVPTTSAKPYETLWNHNGHLIGTQGEEGANCTPGGGDQFSPEPPDQADDY